MKRKLLYIIVFLTINSLSAQNWQLVWEDDFNGSSLDQSKWTHDIGTGSQYNLWGWGNGESQFYQSQNTTINNGIATITVKEEPNGIVDSWGNSSYYSSSKITTKGIFDFRYGKVEARIKTIDGQGFWPAFWMLPSNGSWPCDGEIDIMEQWGGNGPTYETTGAAHIGACPGASSYEFGSMYISSGSYADDFHTYAVIWSEDTVKWYIDDVELFFLTPDSYATIPSQHLWPFNSSEWYLMINLAITQAGPNSNTVFPNQMEIDYVRVYQENLTSVNVVSKDNTIAFPNPVSNYFSVNSQEFTNLKLYNFEGKLLLERDNASAKRIDVSDLYNGIYLLELENKVGLKRHEKIIINN